VGSIAFVHAHPDDEAIFSGGTISALAGAGHRVVLVVATGGELGITEPDSELLADLRRSEAMEAAASLGARAVHFLGYRDSGLLGDPANLAAGSFWSADVDEAAGRLAGLLEAESVDTVIVYDEHGIYGHPDHVQGHRVGIAAARLVGVDCLYEMTVDREYLHFVETHLVEEAALAGDLGLAGSGIGRATAEIDLTIDVRRHLGPKRAAMAAHVTQLPEHAPVFGLDDTRFGEVYGWEWFVRRGPRGPLDELAG
jgi:LmbE family N-acetylglucosaminyl deacetylase